MFIQDSNTTEIQVTFTVAGPVEDDFGYRITGMPVSNFTTSAYFKPGGKPHTKHDFGGVLTATFSVTMVAVAEFAPVTDLVLSAAAFD